MKAIIENKDTYKITGEKGDFYIAENNRGKVEFFAKHQVEIVDIDEMPKPKKYRTMKISKSQADRNHRELVNRMNMAELKGNFLDCQIESGLYNKDLIK